MHFSLNLVRFQPRLKQRQRNAAALPPKRPSLPNPPIPVEGDFTLFAPKTSNQGLRRSRRYRCPLATVGKVRLSDKQETNQACNKDVDLLNACVLNVSKTGVGLSMSEPLEVGAEIELLLRLQGGKSRTSFAVRVIHATQEADRTWRIGCVFESPLTTELLELFLP